MHASRPFRESGRHTSCLAMSLVGTLCAWLAVTASAQPPQISATTSAQPPLALHKLSFDDA
eukprot:5840354-Prymnesium_polylepis.1